VDVKRITKLFSGPEGVNEARKYLSSVKLLDVLSIQARQIDDRILPDYRDLARLHTLIKARKVFTILEFGVGYSTFVMAHALESNRNEWEILSKKPTIRNSKLFELHSVDTSRRWIEIAKGNLPDTLNRVVTIHHSDVSAGTFHDRACHFYDQLPDIVPDFVYLDGPAAREVKGDIHGTTWGIPERVVMAADLLTLEPLFLPGTCIVIDGRVANMRFLVSHFYRNWSINRNSSGDVTAMELQESPLGNLNCEVLDYCHGDRMQEWPNQLSKK